MILRSYQDEILDLMRNMRQGRYLVQMATGLGKTIVFTEYINTMPKGMRFLILSHREELVNQPLKYLKGKVGIENGTNKSDGEDIILASVQTMVKRLKNFGKNYFDVIITDEAHHAPAKTYQKIYDYFNFIIHFGFTATPNRFDNVRLDNVYDSIIYEKDLKWGIENDYLSDIYCKRFYINYDLNRIKTSNNDYQLKQLDAAVNTVENSKAIADIYYQHSIGSTLIFGVSVGHCYSIQEQIPDSVVIEAKTKDRDKIIEDFTNRKIKCLINCMIFTEGTDLPLVETIIIARPTKNISLYTQMVGRGLRKHLDKKQLLLIDCCGVTNMSLCTAPSLLGVNVIDKPKSTIKDLDLEGDLFDLPEKISKSQDIPEYWVINHKVIDIWAKGLNFNMHNINFYKMPSGIFTLRFGKVNIKINPPNELGLSMHNGVEVKFQKLIDRLYTWLCKNHDKEKYIWDLSLIKRWGRSPASPKQIELVKRFCPTYDISNLSKLDAAQILNRFFNK